MKGGRFFYRYENNSFYSLLFSDLVLDFKVIFRMQWVNRRGGTIYQLKVMNGVAMSGWERGRAGLEIRHVRGRIY